MRLVLIGFVFVCFMPAGVSAAGPGELIGVTSCATSTCHGGVVDSGKSWHSAFSTWVANDPHAGAGLLLRDEDSREIVERLAPAAANSAAAFDTVLRTRCISCHVTATSEECKQGGELDDAVLARGVACESCHGPAGSWLQPHIRVDWAGPASETGMIDTESIIGRAETCVRCHIGSRTNDGLIRDMNHDLIAAGHPALRFDLLVYNENLPKHWDESKDAQLNESAVRVRSVSRAINLATAATLSAERASDHLKDSIVPWPELADYDCFACHQSLSMAEYELPSTGKTKSALHVSDGLPVWNAWYTINQLQIRENEDWLRKLSPHRSDPAQLISIANTIATRLRKLADEHMSESFDPQDMLNSPLKQLQQKPPVDWHQAAIQYLELDAAARDLARGDTTAARGKRLLELLRDVEQLLRFDATRSGGDAARYDSPTKFDPAKFQQTALSLLEIQPADNSNN